MSAITGMLTNSLANDEFSAIIDVLCSVGMNGFRQKELRSSMDLVSQMSYLIASFAAADYGDFVIFNHNGLIRHLRDTAGGRMHIPSMFPIRNRPSHPLDFMWCKNDTSFCLCLFYDTKLHRSRKRHQTAPNGMKSRRSRRDSRVGSRPGSRRNSTPKKTRLSLLWWRNSAIADLPENLEEEIMASPETSIKSNRSTRSTPKSPPPKSPPPPIPTINSVSAHTSPRPSLTSRRSSKSSERKRGVEMYVHMYEINENEWHRLGPYYYEFPVYWKAPKISCICAGKLFFVSKGGRFFDVESEPRTFHCLNLKTGLPEECHPNMERLMNRHLNPFFVSSHTQFVCVGSVNVGSKFVITYDAVAHSVENFAAPYTLPIRVMKNVEFQHRELKWSRTLDAFWSLTPMVTSDGMDATWRLFELEGNECLQKAFIIEMPSGVTTDRKSFSAFESGGNIVLAVLQDDMRCYFWRRDIRLLYEMYNSSEIIEDTEPWSEPVMIQLSGLDPTTLNNVFFTMF